MATKVLIVDDDETVRMFVQATLEGIGWKTLEGRNGQEALDLAHSEQPDLIILDVNMPVMDGFEAFRRLRDSPFTEKIPIIFLSGVHQERGLRYSREDIETAYGVPAPEGFVEKPVDGAFLLQCVLGVMG